jgi:hypothetical protein
MNTLMTSMYLSTPNSSQPNSRAPSAAASPAHVNEDDDLFIIDRCGSSKAPKPKISMKKKTFTKPGKTTVKYAVCPRCRGLSHDFATCHMCLETLPDEPEFEYAKQMTQTLPPENIEAASEAKAPQPSNGMV